MWIWKGQLRLDSWPNRLVTAGLFLWALWLAVPLGYSFVGVCSKRLDRAFVGVLRKWHEAWGVRKKANGGRRWSGR